MATPIRHAVVVAFSVLLGCAACSSSPHHEPKPTALIRLPADAKRAIADLVSQNPAAVREALAAAYSAQASTVSLAPAGTQIRVLPSTWQQQGSEARVRAVVSEPGKASVTEVIYLVREEGQWRVLFTDAP